METRGHARSSRAHITVRRAKPGDGQALVDIHREMAEYYVALAPGDFQAPSLDGFAREVDADIESDGDEDVLRLVAEIGDEVIGALIARIVGPDDGAERDIAPDATLRRLRVDYLATAGAHRRSGVATRLVGAAEAWGRERGARVVEASTYARSPVSMPFWKDRMGFAELTVNLRKDL